MTWSKGESSIIVFIPRSGSNQPKTDSIEYPSHIEQSKKITKKFKSTNKKKGLGTKDVRTSSVPVDSPSMVLEAKKKNITN